MSQTAHEVVRVGARGARIVRVTRERVEYVDTAGREQFVDLPQCARNWVRWHEDRRAGFGRVGDASEARVAAWNARCVGQRGAYDTPPWTSFMNERGTRFEFETYEELYRQLLGPLRDAGWHTFDTN
jgi:hypothetical protein